MLSSYSHNSLSTFESCPRKFKFQYIEKIEIPRRVAAELYLGNAVHRTLHQLYQRAADNVEWPLDQLIAFFDAEWEKPERKEIEVLKEYMTVDGYIENGRKMLRTYYNRYRPFNDGVLLGAELSLSADIPDTRFRLKGRVDRLWKRSDGVIEVIDYKTGNSSLRGGADPRFLFQMGIYHLLVKANYPQFARIALVQCYLKTDEIVSYELTDDQADELTERIRGTIIDTIHAEKLDAFPPHEDSSCDYCDFQKLCPAKRHKFILETESGAGDGKEKSTAESAAALAERFIQIDAEKKRIAAEHDALKQDIVDMARELQLAKLQGKSGSVSVKIINEEKFPTKTRDEEAFLEVSSLVRQFQLEPCLKLDTGVLEDMYQKQQLPPELLARLSKFVQQVESTRVSARKNKVTDDGEE